MEGSKQAIQRASKQVRQAAREPASVTARKQASKSAIRAASKKAGKRDSKQASKPAREPASTPPIERASQQATSKLSASWWLVACAFAMDQEAWKKSPGNLNKIPQRNLYPDGPCSMDVLKGYNVCNAWWMFIGTFEYQRVSLFRVAFSFPFFGWLLSRYVDEICVLRLAYLYVPVSSQDWVKWLDPFLLGRLWHVCAYFWLQVCLVLSIPSKLMVYEMIQY